MCRTLSLAWLCTLLISLSTLSSAHGHREHIWHPHGHPPPHHHHHNKRHHPPHDVPPHHEFQPHHHDMPGRRFALKDVCTVPNGHYRSQNFDINGNMHYFSITMLNTVPIIQLVRKADENRIVESRLYTAMPTMIPKPLFNRFHDFEEPQTPGKRPPHSQKRDFVCKGDQISYTWNSSSHESSPETFTGAIIFRWDGTQLRGVVDVWTNLFNLSNSLTLLPVIE